jgi:hypothetical protein
MTGGNIVDFQRERAVRDHIVARGGGGGRGGGSTLDERVARLEVGLDGVRRSLDRFEPLLTRIEERLSAVEDRSTAVELKLAELSGRVSQVPTLPQLVTVMMSVFAGAIALVGASLALARFFFGS